MASKRAVVLHILENENEKPRSARVPYNGDANLEGFRAFLEGFKEKPIVPWPFDFWDSELKTRIATSLEQISPLELHADVVTIIKSHGGKSVAGNASMAISKPTTMEEVIPSVSTRPGAGVPSSSSCKEEELRCPMLEPKHKIFLSHSGEEKPFAEQLCRDLERQNHFPFFDQRDDSLPKGEKFADLIFEAAKQCKVAVVVLSEGFLGSKWPMLELVSFVRAKQSTNESLTLLPLFYKVSVDALSDDAIEKEWRPKWLQLVQPDRGDKVEEWVAAVRVLRSINGLSFELFRKSEVKYRENIVDQIFLHARPDMLYDTSQISGCDRICKMLEGEFRPHDRTCSQVLGLYGMGGLGKTTVSKLLCNHFNQEYSGRVCYIEIKEESKPLERQQVVMRTLLGWNETWLQNQSDVSQGWSILQHRMREQPVFLVIDNVQSDEVSKEEARNYLRIEYNARSKVVVTSRGAVVVEDLLGGSRYCHPVPFLQTEEAAEVFLRHVDSSMNYSILTEEEKGSIIRCLKEACSSDQDGDYHPMALIALGVYFHDQGNNSEVLSWNLNLPEYRELKSTGESNIRIYRTLGLKFSTLDRETQLMFIDVCLFAKKALTKPMLSNSPLEDLIAWLANIHGVKIAVVRSKIKEFKGFGMIDINKVEATDVGVSFRRPDPNALRVVIHDLYIEYAIWFLDHIREEVTGIWCIGDEDFEGSLPPQLQRARRKFWKYLRRIRLEDMRFDGFLLGKVQDWCNVVVLQLVYCNGLISMNLQGLTSLCHLELKYLSNLKILTFTGDGSSSTNSMSQGTHTELDEHQISRCLQFVIIEKLSSLERLPSFSLCTSLKFLCVMECENLTQPPCVQGCVGLERIWIQWFPRQKALPNLDGLVSLRDLTIYSLFSFDYCDGKVLPFHYYEGEALKIEGLSSLISLGALELFDIPVGDLAGLENLTRLQYISLHGIDHLTRFPTLDNVETSPLHYVYTSGTENASLKCMLEKLKSSVSDKVDRLARNGQSVPHIPCKIGPGEQLTFSGLFSPKVARDSGNWLEEIWTKGRMISPNLHPIEILHTILQVMYEMKEDK